MTTRTAAQQDAEAREAEQRLDEMELAQRDLGDLIDEAEYTGIDPETGESLADFIANSARHDRACRAADRRQAGE